MGFTKDQLISHLKELQIEFTQYQHPPVLTVEAQAEYVGDKGSALSKNLFLKDKKNRFYIVSALPDTKIDMKVLSQRLGLGKGGIRMAPEEALGEILQVPLGCVTPFALINESARHVSLLLDKGFRSHECCFFHPLSNDTSIAINFRGLDKFLASIEISPTYVDLEANPPVGKDQPPDLAAFVPSGSTILPNPQEGAASVQLPVQNPVDVVKEPAKVLDMARNPKHKSASIVPQQPSPFSNTGIFVKETINKISALVLSEITEKTIEKHGENLGTVVEEKIRKHLYSDLESSVTMLKNIAYTEGFHSGRLSGSYKPLFSCP